MTFFPRKELTLKKLGILALCSTIYLLIVWLLVGLKAENWILILAYNFFFLLSDTTRKFVAAFSIFIVFGIVYDLMKAFPNYMVNTIDVLKVYGLEKNLFGIHSNGSILTPNEYFAINHKTFLDLLSGFFYINWMPIPLGLALYFYYKDKLQFLHFSLTFLLTNVIGFCIYYIHPAAPPWYLANYGTTINVHTMGNPAGLARFDSFFNIPIFHSIYSRNSNVFAAMPSLHSAYPVIVLYYAIKNKLGYINWFFALFVIGIWFSAVYSGHHYIVDVIAGLCCAITGIFVFQFIVLKRKVIVDWLLSYNTFIS
jgi:membrane-associated phospholipid phosphatase